MTTLFVQPDGQVRCLYDETIDLASIGALHIRRASRVEPDRSGRWWTDLSPAGGPVLGPFACRSQALSAERCWLDDYVESACNSSRLADPTRNTQD
jgi:hypothetical protein